MEYRWIEIEDYGRLKISEYGDVYGINNYLKMRAKSVDKDGYFRTNIKYRNPHYDKNGLKRKYRTLFNHRLVAQCFIPNPDNLPVVNHKDGNKQNNHYTNLEWCTVEYNNNHAIESNLYNKIDFKGETNPKNKLNREQVLEIRQKYNSSNIKGYKFYDIICEEYGVNRETIRNICKRITWKNI